MVNMRKCVVSCNLFWGYTKNIDIDEFDNKEDIVITVINSLIEDLEKINLNELVLKLKDLRLNNKFHIHRDFGELLISEEVIYVCNH